MKLRILFIIVFSLCGFYAKSQFLTLNQLEYLASLSDWQYMNNYLLNQGWIFVRADSSEIVWAFEPKKKYSYNGWDLEENLVAPAWFSYDSDLKAIAYQVALQSDYYNKLMSWLKIKNYQKKDQYVKQEELYISYENYSFRILIVQESETADDVSGEIGQILYIYIQNK